MKINDASTLIHKAFQNDNSVERWADLGCGRGTLTYALAYHLNPFRMIYAVPKVSPHINSTTD